MDAEQNRKPSLAYIKQKAGAFLGNSTQQNIDNQHKVRNTVPIQREILSIEKNLSAEQTNIFNFQTLCNPLEAYSYTAAMTCNLHLCHYRI